MKMLTIRVGVGIGILLPALSGAAEGQTQLTVAREVVQQILESQNIAQLRPGETVSLLSGVLIATPEDFQEVIGRPLIRARVSRSDYQRCAAVLTAFGDTVRRGLSPATTHELEEIGAKYGFDPRNAERIVSGSREVAEIAIGLAEETRMAAAIAAGQPLGAGSKDLLTQRQQVVNLARNAMGNDMFALIAGGDTWRQMFATWYRQTSVITGLLCP